MLQRFLGGESGQGVAEYGLILALAAVAAAAALGLLGAGTLKFYDKAVSGVESAEAAALG